MFYQLFYCWCGGQYYSDCHIQTHNAERRFTKCHCVAPLFSRQTIKCSINCATAALAGAEPLISLRKKQKPYVTENKDNKETLQPSLIFVKKARVT
jgi:hypothetical protein